MSFRRLASFALLIFAILPCMARGAALIEVNYKTLNKYWIPSSTDMSATMPPLVQSAFSIMHKNERITLDYEVTINSKGIPVDFKFKSITPSDVDPKPFIAMVMFYRYRPAVQNTSRSAVRVHGPMPFFTPQK